ncbi:MAG: GlsB/YeaQ/YmgE family stress response membrane protein [Burkholderiaceae bacterium]|jgi:uncharacterized membrane protein YeaQ/YmgE (transglycosylase-associated protein family)
MSYVWMALVGFVVGLVARALMPGNQRMGLILTALLGIAGSFVANAAGQWLGWYASGQVAGFIASVVGALLVLWVVGLLRKGGQGGD